MFAPKVMNVIDAITHNETIQLVADPYPPYQYLEGETTVGADHDVIVAAFRERGLRSETRLLPWDECMGLMESGEAHGIFQIQPTLEREKAFIFSEPLRTARTVLFRNMERGADLSRIERLEPVLERWSLATVKGYSYHPAIDRLEEPNRIVMESQDALLTGLSKGEFDLAIIDLGVGAFLIRKLGIRNIVRVKSFEIARVLHVAFRKDLNHLVEVFSAGLKTIEEKGIRDQILRKYGVSD
jgi:polar amino acid transport system substrate-binding protein